MKIIKAIKDENFNLKSKEFTHPIIRLSARGIIFNNDGKIALLHKIYKNEYKLIGGGLKKNESPEQAFIRESLEESGCKIKIIENLGIIKEDRSMDNFQQISYVFTAKVIKDLGRLRLTIKEINEGAQIIWMDFDAAIIMLKESEENIIPSKYENIYHSKFIVRRDYEILKYYQILRKKG